MKILIYLILTGALLISIGCSSAKSGSANNSPETNVKQDNSNPGSAESAGADTNLGKVSPDQVVKQLYDLHKAEKSPFFKTKDRPLLDKYFEKTLADLIWNDLNSNGDEVGVLDFDVLYNAQDIEIKKLSVGPAKIDGEKASVVVTFENFGDKQTITFALVKKGEAWKISDIKYTGGETLLGYFKEDAKNKAESNGEDGNFEGTYQVGETTCVVKPAKMSFEVKWAKGSGTMMFFFDSDAADEFTYISEDNGKGSDKFIFDNAGLKTGKFIRADGKEMPVKKVSGK